VVVGAVAVSRMTIPNRMRPERRQVMAKRSVAGGDHGLWDTAQALVSALPYKGVMRQALGGVANRKECSAPWR